MFRSEFSGEIAPPRTRPLTFVIERRDRQYPGVVDGNGGRFNDGFGWEIVRTIRVLPTGVEAVRARYPEAVRV